MSGLIAWNAGTRFPAFLHGFEVWARRQGRPGARTLTRYLTQFGTPGPVCWWALVVIAVVPAVAEELVFRGVIQQNLVRWFNSRHVGVWVAAAIFSAIHLQFFGLRAALRAGAGAGLSCTSGAATSWCPWRRTSPRMPSSCCCVYLRPARQLRRASFDPDSTAALPWPAGAGSRPCWQRRAALACLHRRMVARRARPDAHRSATTAWPCTARH
ncbi:MAG: CPBP family intramembrane glutamic endopeptidase [Hymenobacter sp.]